MNEKDFNRFCQIIEDERCDFVSSMLEFDPPVVLSNKFTTLMGKIVTAINNAYKAC